MKKILLCLLLACSFMAKAQVYNNEWINFSNTYYKFKVGKTGLYRISQTALVAAGLGGGGAEQFQLWRNGVEIPIYTSIPTGTLSATDYIEFWGEMNDGKPDKDLYRDPDYQLNDKWSLETDSATYFLTIATSPVKRLVPATNDVAANTLAPEPYFMHTVGAYFRNKIKGGYAVYVDNQYLYSSSYDKGEGWASTEIGSNGTNSLTFSNLQVYAAGPASKFWIGLAGDAIAQRNYIVRINNDSIVGGPLDYYNYAKASASFPTSLIATNTAAVQVKNVCTMSPCPTSDRMSVYKYEITYPRLFDFGAATNFEFNLPASSVGNYLEIKNFAYGTSAPVLYDLTNGKRYVADVTAAPVVRVVLEPSITDRRLVLVSEASTNINSVNSFQQRVFRDYLTTDNQADYMIISNSVLFSGSNGSNPVEEYRAYRASSAGGAYNAKIYLVDEIIDQFGFGIKKNPLAIRNFLLFARTKFSIAPRQVFIIGKGVEYTTQRLNENANLEKLNLVPTFGVPASDLLYTADRGSSVPRLPIGRLSVVNGQEISDYLNKVKQYEQVQQSLSPNIADKAWMKNVLQFSGGGGEQTLATLLASHIRDFGRIISDTLFGGNVHSFTKETSSTIDYVNNTLVPELFAQGLSLVTYFGHSTSTTFEFNIENPNIFNNPSKYPLFVALGCNAGNIYGANITRLSARDAISENYTLTPNKGSIGFIASTHFGIVHYLGIWGNSFYNSLSNYDYGKPIGEVLNLTAQKMFDFTTEEDFYSRSHVEELNLVGDPAIKINSHAKPDYAIEPNLVESKPFVSVLDKFLRVSAKIMNIGMAVNRDVVIEVKHERPDLSTHTVYTDTIRGGIDYEQLINISIPIDEILDKGLNKFTFTIDPLNEIDELFESNNSITKEYTVYENEARPIYPFNFSIVSSQATKFYASTANPLLDEREYKFEIDTTELFNSPLKIASTLKSVGGLLEFAPSVNYLDSTVYYWRVAAVPDNGNDYRWNSFSFIYLPNSSGGFNQSHLYQHFKSSLDKIELDSVSRAWRFPEYNNLLFAQNGVYPNTSGENAFYKAVLNNVPLIGGGCAYNEIIINIINPIGFQPWKNNYSGTTGLYGSMKATCFANRIYNFEYSLGSSADRKKAMDLLDLVPDGYYVLIRSNTNPKATSNTYVNTWKSDTSLFGSGNSLYHKLVSQGVQDLDSFYTPRSWIFLYKKNDHAKFETESIVSRGIYDGISINAICPSPYSVGYIASPDFGPASAWKELMWDGSSSETVTGDDPKVSVIGIKNDGFTDTLFNNLNLTQKTVDISSIDAKTYPYLRISMKNVDTTGDTPYQLKYWRLTYDPVPEGAVAPNLSFQMKDTSSVGEGLDFKLAFKNVSSKSFDSLKIKMIITDKSNVQHVLPIQRYRPLNPNDTIVVQYPINSKEFSGINTLYVEVNPDNDQPEQYLFNNFIYHNFYVLDDTTNPYLDVTFDNVHILDHDIVSSKPEILIKLKDQGSRLLLSDTSLITVKVRQMNGNVVRTYQVDGDTLRFNPASQLSDNTASLVFKPYFYEDGEYELIVSGEDERGNKAGNIEYKIAFQVINKPMISNLLNYPNPFTTSTAFVFTLTGSEIPQNLRIQILTVTGKVVKEITKQELGTLRIGRNITEYKWDGTDQYGQKVGNGVYLYRVITNLNGKSLDKYKSENDNTDKYFNKGYGKMYLMR